MRVFMLGWEFPPFISGGLGTACYGLTKALSGLGTEVLFVLPRGVANHHVHGVKVVSVREGAGGRSETYWTLEGLEHVRLVPVASGLVPYATEEEYEARREEVSRHVERTTEEASVAVPLPAAAHRATSLGITASPDLYAGDLLGEVHRYARVVADLARRSRFDVVHAHDWMTYPAAMAVAAMSGKPFVAHIHSTEFDRSGPNVNQQVYDIERAGLHAARVVICVSRLTRDLVTSRYGVPAAKCRVIYNAITVNGDPISPPIERIEKDDKIVLFVGRITMQKGPEYFLAAAKKVLEVMDNVKFVMAGSGDMIKRMIELAAAMGIGHRVTFTGFLKGEDLDRVFQMADLYVMPSVSEPFGLAPLEALSHDVPVLISKQSGVSEVLTHALKVDFWDINEMANKIVAVLRHPPLQRTLREHGAFEVRKFSWDDAAKACLGVYGEAMGSG
ncbi:MAG TPA: glycosyltransferase family 4 protein [Phycisphaerae bacterium]|nr:glycosyltransferase family 4 protein [Phycisphaerae bacterium]